ncbi:hypothetical protein ACVWZX_002789 [Deinococcus sp. UYEF24]
MTRLRENHPFTPADEVAVATIRAGVPPIRMTFSSVVCEVFDQIMLLRPTAENITTKVGEVGGVHS